MVRNSKGRLPHPAHPAHPASQPSSSDTTTRTKAATSSAHFETSKWLPVLLALTTILSTSTDGEYLPGQCVYGRVRSAVVVAMYHVLDIAIEFTRAEFTANQIDHLEHVSVPRALQSLHSIYDLRQALHGVNTNFRGIKLHILLHIPHFIRRYGAPTNWDSASFESAHKSFVKFYYRNGSKR